MWGHLGLEDGLHEVLLLSKAHLAVLLDLLEILNFVLCQCVVVERATLDLVSGQFRLQELIAFQLHLLLGLLLLLCCILLLLCEGLLTLLGFLCFLLGQSISITVLVKELLVDAILFLFVNGSKDLICSPTLLLLQCELLLG